MPSRDQESHPRLLAQMERAFWLCSNLSWFVTTVSKQKQKADPPFFILFHGWKSRSSFTIRTPSELWVSLRFSSKVNVTFFDQYWELYNLFFHDKYIGDIFFFLPTVDGYLFIYSSSLMLDVVVGWIPGCWLPSRIFPFLFCIIPPIDRRKTKRKH